jgi:hypothetical protein
MPRGMPPLGDGFRSEIKAALALAAAAELAMTGSPRRSALRKEWHVSRVEMLYELAYLRLFIEWEGFLEQTLYRYMCGYNSSCHNPTPSLDLGRFCVSVERAETIILNGRPYALWHNPKVITDRAKRWLSACPHETVIASYQADLENYAAVRHRIAHGQDDAKAKFDSATMTLVGRRYRGARPGRFLRDWDTSATPQVRWLESLGSALSNLAAQIA